MMYGTHALYAIFQLTGAKNLRDLIEVSGKWMLHELKQAKVNST